MGEGRRGTSRGEGPPAAERRLVLALIAVTLFLTCLPYLLGYFITPPGTQFIGTAYNIDDYCNYLSWLRQTADGHFFLRNLFTTEPQKGLEFNVFFWLLGQLVRFLHVSPQAALQLARVGGGVGLLWLIYRFYRFCVPGDASARLTAFGFACLSSGWGWLTWAHWEDKNLAGSPVDAWQPEAYTFLSLYASALFTVSTLLIVGTLYALLLGEETGQWRYPVIAGLCGAFLGNMHSYDVLHIAGAWGLFLVVWTLLRRGRGIAATWYRALLALALTQPTTLYQYYVFQAETVFHERAEVRTMSPHFWYYVWGYGLVFILAVIAVVLLVAVVGLLAFVASNRGEPNELHQQMVQDGVLATTSASDGARRALLFAMCWAIAGLLIIYLPVAFQRKMLMGEHIPLCLLAGYGASMLVQWQRGDAAGAWKSAIPPGSQTAILIVLVLLSFPSNAFFLRRDMVHLVQNRSETHLTPFLSDTLVDVYGWLRAHTPADAAVVGFPSLCTALPGYAGRTVWAGHWGETPHYADKETEFAAAMDAQTPDSARRAFLADTKAQYLFYPNDVVPLGYKDAQGFRHATASADLAHRTPAYLTRVYANKDYTIFRISG